MKARLPILSLLLLLTSCQFFETEKISSETFYEEKLRTIDWNDVTQYPLFPQCVSLTEKSEQRNCFSNVLREALGEMKGMATKVVNEEIEDTVWVHLEVSETAQLSIRELKMDSLTEQLFPLMREGIISMVDSLELVEPAYKEGVPVKTEFSLPIVIQTQ
jgi:hypothetical protein